MLECGKGEEKKFKVKISSNINSRFVLESEFFPCDLTVKVLVIVDKRVEIVYHSLVFIS